MSKAIFLPDDYLITINSLKYIRKDFEILKYKLIA